MNGPSDWTLADCRRHVPQIIAERDDALAALRDARAENRALLDENEAIRAERRVIHKQSLRREAELRARIEALCGTWGVSTDPTAHAIVAELRAALSPAETEAASE